MPANFVSFPLKCFHSVFLQIDQELPMRSGMAKRSKKRVSTKKKSSPSKNRGRKPLRSESLENRLVLTCSAAAADFDMDGSLDGDDVDSLIAEIAAGTNNPDFDLTGDNLVNAADLEDWITNRKGTVSGDANLDFVVDVSDFNSWNQNKFTQGGGWTGGDFSGDGSTDVTDFNIWNSFKFQTGTGTEAFVDFGLTQDTGVSPIDNITSELGICGNVNASNFVSAELTLLGSGNSLAIPANGDFELTRSEVETAFGPIDDGGLVFELAKVDTNGNTTSQVLNIRLDTVATETVIGPDLGLQGPQSTLDVTFSEKVSSAALEVGSYSLTYVGGPNDGQLIGIDSVHDVDGRAVRLVPSTPLQDSQAYRLNVTPGITDLAGNELSGFTFNFNVNESFALTEVVPENGGQSVALTQNIEIRLAEPVDPATVNNESLKVITLGEEATGRISVSADGDTITFFGDQPWAASAEVRVQVNGDLITTLADGTKLDADGDGTAGGTGTFDFTTVSVSRIPGTNVSGRVVASDPGPNGGDVPLEGVTIRVDGFPELDVTTNANGEFTLVDVPAPDFFVHIDGATTQLQAGDPVPSDGYYPVVGKEFHSVPGQSTIMPFNIHLPFVLDEAISDVVPNQEVTVTLPDSQTANNPDLEMVSLTVPANSLMNEDGSAGTQVGIYRVDSTRLPAPLPNNLNHSFDITVQADAPIFDQPAEMTFPNTDGLAPGEKTLLMSFDHARAEWVVVGSMTVSADGLTMTSDPGQGVRAPGWHGVQNGVSVTTQTPTPKPPARGVFETGLQAAGDAGRAFLTGIGVLTASVDNVPLVGQAPVVDQGLSLVSGVTLTISRFSDGEITAADRVAALTTANALNPEPITGTAVDLTQLALSVEGFTNSTTSFATESAPAFITAVGQATGVLDNDWANTIDDINARTLDWAANFKTMVDGAIAVRTTLDAVGDGELSQAEIDTIIDGLTKISEGYSYFEVRGEILPLLEEISESYANWMEHFHQVYGSLFESANQSPWMVQDSDGNVVSRGVTDADGSFNIVLPANSLFTFTIVDPFRGYASQQQVATGDNGSQVSRTQPIVPTVIVDTDLDGLSDIVEQTIGTSIDNPDTDGDGILDGGEIKQGLNPLDGRGFPTGIISNLPLPGSASDVVTAGRPDNAEDIHAYVATGAHGLVIMDIARFDNAILLGQIDLPGINQSVAVNSDRSLAAVAAGSFGLHIVDISEPMAPELVRTENLAGSVTNVELNNGLIYATVGNRLVSLDLVTGQEIETTTLGGTITDISREGSTLYTMDSTRTLRGIDISAFTMVPRGSSALPNGGSKLFVGGGIAYASNINAFVGGFATVDVSDPDNFVLISDVDVPAGVDAVEGPIAATGSGLAVQGGRTAGVAALSILDVSDPSNTDDFVTRIDLPRTPTGVSIAGGIAIVSDGTAGVQVVNYLPFDTAQVAPTVNVQPDFNDVDGGTAGIQVVEGSSLPFSLEVTDDVQVRSVELLIDGIPFASDITFPYELTTPAVSSVGLDQLTTQIRVVDGGGNITLSNPIDIDIVPDTIAPSILSMDPEDGSERSRLQRQFRITFDEPMNGNTLNADTLQIFDPNGNLVQPEFIEIGFNETAVTLSYPELAEGTHEFRMNQSMIRDRAGNILGPVTEVTSFDVVGSTAFWIGSSGNFNDPANWNTGVVPGPMDDVLISVPGEQTITVTANHTLLGLRSSERFNVVSGSLQVTAEGQLLAGLDQSGGSVGGAAPLEIFSDSVISTGSIVGTGGITNFGNLEIQGNPTLSGLLTNANHITHTAFDFNFNSGTVNNLATGTYEIQSGQLDANSGSWTFNNEGVILKTGDLAATIDVYLSQLAGTVQVDEGALSLTRSGQHLTGDYVVSEDAQLTYDGGTFDFLGPANGMGDGGVVVNTTWRVPDGFFASVDYQGDLLQWNSASYQLGDGMTNLGTINLINAPNLTGVLNNEGTIIHNAFDLNFSSATINNRKEGLYEIQSGQLDANSGFWIFNNEGVIRKTTDSSAEIDVYLSQLEGSVEVLDGNLFLPRGSRHAAGHYSVATGATLNYNAGIHDFAGLATGSGNGSIHVTSTWRVPAGEQATINYAPDLLFWNAGFYSFADLTNLGEINWAGSSNFDGVLHNESLIVHTADDLNFNSATINNRPGGVYELRSGQVDANSGSWTFNNEGLIQKTGETAATIDVFLQQLGGEIEVVAGDLFLQRGSRHVSGNYDVSTDATLNYNFGTHNFVGLATGTGDGVINVATNWTVPLGEQATIDYAADLLFWNAGFYSFADLTNVGTVQWAGSSSFDGVFNNDGLVIHTADDLNFNSATLNNRASGIYEIQSGQLDANTGSWTFNNEGLLRKTGATGATIDVFLQQLGGEIEVVAGDLFLQRGSRHVSGNYDVSTDATLNYNFGTHNFVGLATGTGDGAINVATNVDRASSVSKRPSTMRRIFCFGMPDSIALQ